MNKNSNGGMKLDLSGVFQMGDLIMMVDALEYAATRSFMNDGKDASGRFQEIIAQLKAVSPLPKGDRTMGHEWYRACKAAAKCAYFGAYMVKHDISYRQNDFHLDVVCDGEIHRVVSSGMRGEIEAALPGIRACLRDLAPIEAESVTLLKGLVDLFQNVAIRQVETQEWENRGRLDPVQARMKELMSPVTPYVHVIDASNFWSIQSVVDARFAVPVSAAQAVIAHVADLNASVIAEYSKNYQSKEFIVAPAL